MCGYAPFQADTDEETIKKIENGGFAFKRSEWKNVTSDCQNLISGLLKKQSKGRLTSEQALNHTWIKDMGYA